MVNNKCKKSKNGKHEWYKLTEADNRPSIYRCKNCGMRMYASELFQLEALKDQLGFKNLLSVIAIIISVVALIISYIGSIVLIKP